MCNTDFLYSPPQPGRGESGEILPPGGDGRDRQRDDPLQDLPDQQLLRLSSVSAVQTGGCVIVESQPLSGLEMLTGMRFFLLLLLPCDITGSVSGRRAEQTTHGLPEEAGGHSDQRLQRPLCLGSDQNSLAVETQSCRCCFHPSPTRNSTEGPREGGDRRISE